MARKLTGVLVALIAAAAAAAAAGTRRRPAPMPERPAGRWEPVDR